jgi:predicted phosphodiesterase
MMKIIALSDTHLTGPLPDELLDIVRGADIVLHAGDFVTLAAYESLKGACKRLIAVHGNSVPLRCTVLPEALPLRLTV